MIALFKKLDQRIAAELKRQRKSIIAGLVCSTITSLLTAAIVPIVKYAVDSVSKGDVQMLTWLAASVVGMYGIKYWFTRGQSYYLAQAANRLASDLRIRLFEKLQRLPMSYFNEKRSGAIQSVITNDVGVYQGAIGLVRDSIDGPIKIVSGLVMIFVIQWKLALIAFAILPLFAFVIQRNSRKMRRAQDEVQDSLSDLSAMMQEAIHGTRVVKAFSAEDRVAGRYRSLVERSYDFHMRAARRLAALRPLVEFIGAIALAAVLYMCGYLVKNGSLQVGDLAAFMMGLDIINQGARSLGAFAQTYAQVQSASDRIYKEVLDAEEAQTDAPGARELINPKGRIEFRNVTFRYPDGTEALKNVSFTIEPGTSLALVGPSGAGKSTIADLLLRFYDPTEGQVLFDDVDLRELKVSSLRDQIGVVPQQTFLFAGTIADNLRLGRPEASQDQLLAAAKAAHATPFIDRMEGQLEAELGERGTRLSGGEMQRVAIARAIVKDPTVLLLDEATSNLDAESEREVSRALVEIMENRSTLMIAHRLTTASRADRILMLRRGEVLEVGSHKELLEANGAYAAMYRAFNAGLIDAELG